jgi:Flp pilus assembly protein TadD
MLRDRGFDPQIADTHGWALANTGQFSDAIDLLEKVVQQRPSPETQDHLGEACLLAGKPAEAKPHLEAALELLRAAEQNGQPNPALRARLEAAQHRAAEMKPAPGGAN